MLNTKFTSWPSFSKEEANAVKNVLLSNKVNYWTGNEFRELKKSLRYGQILNEIYNI